uniref:Uncharacterized protein n=1 Tax=Rhizophagus irregularis (strain DAOM 181602 / DAOM 197198 / MUCL 43194) TaxID=747089 RepID=U9TVI5_RHIID
MAKIPILKIQKLKNPKSKIPNPDRSKSTKLKIPKSKNPDSFNAARKSTCKILTYRDFDLSGF